MGAVHSNGCLGTKDTSSSIIRRAHRSNSLEKFTFSEASEVTDPLEHLFERARLEVHSNRKDVFERI